MKLTPDERVICSVAWLPAAIIGLFWTGLGPNWSWRRFGIFVLVAVVHNTIVERILVATRGHRYPGMDVSEFE